MVSLTGLAKAAKERFWYLGTVYTSHPDGPQKAYLEAIRLSGRLAKAGVKFYSPIIHWHPIAFEAGLPADHDYWMAMDEPMMRRCDGMIYCMMAGHGNSRGLTYEVGAFKLQDKPVVYWDLTAL